MNKKMSLLDMKWINILFFLLIFITNSWFGLLTYGLWIMYLAFQFKNSTDKIYKIVLAFLITFAAAIIILNIYSLLFSSSSLAL